MNDAGGEPVAWRAAFSDGDVASNCSADQTECHPDTEPKPADSDRSGVVLLKQCTFRLEVRKVTVWLTEEHSDRIRMEGDTATPVDEGDPVLVEENTRNETSLTFVRGQNHIALLLKL